MPHGAKPKRTKEDARASLPSDLRPDFDKLVEDVSNWSIFIYGTRFVSYAILAELVRDGWSKRDLKDS